jgi:hypothetical protein
MHRHLVPAASATTDSEIDTFLRATQAGHAAWASSRVTAGTMARMRALFPARAKPSREARRSILTAGAALVVSAFVVPRTVRAAEVLPEVVVYKDPVCDCCAAWMKHIHDAGFSVRVVIENDMTAVQAQHGITARYSSCHTAIVAGYVVEGHVPAKDVKRLLAAKPAAIGLTVPGMPTGAPGMEGPGASGYDVILLDKAGHGTIFASYKA